MEMIDGATLGDMLEQGKEFTEREVVDITIQILIGLKAALAMEIVHRDIKPSNIFMTTAGEIKIADFGIAKAIGASVSTKLTQLGEVIGTPAYISPEVIRCEKVDHRSDIYSLGCVMYELIIQKPPFVGRDYMELFYQHEHKEPAKPSEVMEVSAGFESIILKCLQKKMSDRYSDYDEIIHDLEQLKIERTTARFDEQIGHVVQPQRRDLTTKTLAGIMIVLSIICEFLLAMELGII